jgi:transcriptional accessory protein Tex/SPT6
VATIGDLKVGDELMGTVTNVVPFGAFCDIGVDTTGLCHVRHLSPDPTNDRRKEVDVSDLVAGTLNLTFHNNTTTFHPTRTHSTFTIITF